MAKRFTDTQKWDKAWYRLLGSKLRDVRSYLLDRCDHAGVWDLDLDTLAHYIGEPVSMDEIAKAFRDRTTIIGDKLFIPDFIEFQYGALSEESKPHQAVIARLKKLGIFEGYTKGIHTLKDKDKEKEKEKEGESEGKQNPPAPPRPPPVSDAAKLDARMKFDFPALFAIYPRQQKRTQSLGLLAEKIQTQADFDALWEATLRYRDHCEREAGETKHILTFPKFLEEWRDWLLPETGQSVLEFRKKTINGIVPE